MREFRVEFDAKKFIGSMTLYAKGIGQSVDEATKRLTEKVIDKANQYLDDTLFWPEGVWQNRPDPQKRIKTSWVKRRVKQGYWLGWNTSPHAVWVEYGTGVYGAGQGPITAKEEGKPMKFRLPDGTWVSTYVVRGQPPKYFLSRAIQDIQNEVFPVVKEELLKRMIGIMK